MVKFYASLGYSHGLNLKVPHSLLHLDTWVPASGAGPRGYGTLEKAASLEDRVYLQGDGIVGLCFWLGSLCEERPSKVWRALGLGSHCCDCPSFHAFPKMMDHIPPEP